MEGLCKATCIQYMALTPTPYGTVSLFSGQIPIVSFKIFSCSLSVSRPIGALK